MSSNSVDEFVHVESNACSPLGMYEYLSSPPSFASKEGVDPGVLDEGMPAGHDMVKGCDCQKDPSSDRMKT